MTMLLWLKRTNFFIFVLRILMRWKDVFLWLYFCTWAGNELHVVAWNNADNIESQAQSLSTNSERIQLAPGSESHLLIAWQVLPPLHQPCFPVKVWLQSTCCYLLHFYRKTTNGTLLFKWKSRMDIKLSLYDHHCRLAKLVILSQLTQWTTLEISSLLIQLMF